MEGRGGFENRYALLCTSVQNTERKGGRGVFFITFIIAREKRVGAGSAAN